MQTSVSGVDAAPLLEALTSGAHLFDQRGKLLVVNREAIRIFGYGSFSEAADQVEGRSRKVRALALESGKPGTPFLLVQRALAGETVSEDLERVEPVEGTPCMIVHASYAPVRNREGDIVGVLKTSRDVTLEHDLERRKNEFVALTMHELRTPATALRLWAHRLRCPTPPSADQRRQIADAIDRATRRIEILAVKLQDIAAIARGEAIPLRPTRLRLDTLIAEVVQSLEPEESRRVHMTSSPAEVRADAIRIREVVDALLDNALRYSLAPASVDVRLEPRDGDVELSVADHGIGIPRAKQPHVFEYFYRAHAGTRFDRGGLGASLHLADQIVRQHGGRIWFESAEGHGSTFHVAFRVT